MSGGKMSGVKCRITPDSALHTLTVHSWYPCVMLVPWSRHEGQPFFGIYH